jgi:hypothetical protein
MLIDLDLDMIILAIYLYSSITSIVFGIIGCSTYTATTKIPFKSHVTFNIFVMPLYRFPTSPVFGDTLLGHQHHV